MIHHLRAAGVSLVLDARGAGTPSIVHWGADLGSLKPAELTELVSTGIPLNPPSSIDRPPRLTLLAGLGDGWSGRPALEAGEGGLVAHHDTTVRDEDTIVSTSVRGALRVRTTLRLNAYGVLEGWHRIENTGDVPIPIAAAALLLPVPARAREILDFTGLWARERRVQRQRPGDGVWLRESRHGRGGHDDAMLMAAGTPGFGWRHGELWSTHVAWSGDTAQWFETSSLGFRVLGAGERRAPYVLDPGAHTETPRVVATWSDAGLDGLSDRLHPWIRSWHGARGPRPVTVNTWEAVYFDHRMDRLGALVDEAAAVGAERFVLDDGWFAGRTDETRALGDWRVDPQRWPDGLWPLIDRVQAAGMEFGLWVEPEMVSPDSDLARAHPEWVIPGAQAPTWRWQYALDLAQPAVADYVFESIHALLDEYPIRYLKWDHNRDLLIDDVHDCVQALYRVIDRLRAAHPDVEIESCASGGARIDLGILARVDRVWTSDTNDPLERQRIQRYTGILIPPEYLGAHVGDARAHTSGRTSSLSFRLATAFFGHAGIESDLTALPPSERAQIREWVALHKRMRGLLHSGRVVRVDGAEDSHSAHGVVASDAASALFSVAAMSQSESAVPPPLRVPGLAADARYRVSVLALGAPPAVLQDDAPPWLARGVTLTGRVLAESGLAMPAMLPAEALLIHLHRLEPSDSATAQERPGRMRNTTQTGGHS